MDNTNKKELISISWNCKKACGFCNWSSAEAPVPGWKAEEVKLKIKSNRFIKNYLVLSCPEFVSDKKVKIKIKPKLKTTFEKLSDISVALNLSVKTCISYYYHCPEVLRDKLNKINSTNLFQDLYKEVYL